MKRRDKDKVYHVSCTCGVEPKDAVIANSDVEIVIMPQVLAWCYLNFPFFFFFFEKGIS